VAVNGAGAGVDVDAVHDVDRAHQEMEAELGAMLSRLDQEIASLRARGCGAGDLAQHAARRKVLSRLNELKTT
jgi:hypothetical protein